MLTPGQVERFPAELESQFSELEMRIMQDIVRRININGEITSSADWQLIRLRELGQSEQFIKKTLAIMLKQTDKEVSELFREAAQQQYVRDKELYAKTSNVFTPYKQNIELQQFVESISDQTLKEFSNITNSLGFATQSNGKMSNVDLTTYYRKTLDNAMLDIASGAFSKESVIKRTVKEMTNSGLRTVDYASGYSTRANVAVRRTLNTGLGQLTAKVNEVNAKKLGTNDYEVSWHGTARPTHQIWQGRVYNYEELISVCELGSVIGLCGANCRHTYRPFIKGISIRTYTDEELKKMNEDENKTHKFGNKEYTAYEATQRMRQLETRMRALRQNVKILEQNGGAENDILAEKAKYRQINNEYTKFAEKMELPQQKQRIYDDGLGKVMGGKGVAKAIQNDIIKSGIKDLGFKGKINLEPLKIDVEKLLFDDVHINAERLHNITFDEAKAFIQNAKISESVWNGKYERYYSEKGSTYVDMKSNKIRTAFSSEEYSDNLIKMMEVLKNNGR